MELKDYVGKYGVLNDAFRKNTDNRGNSIHRFSESLVKVLELRESKRYPLYVSKEGEKFHISPDEINLLDENDPIINLKVGQEYDQYFNLAIIQMIDYKNRKMQLKYDDNSSEVVDIPKIKQTPIREFVDLSSFELSVKESLNQALFVNTDHALHKKLIENMHEVYLIKNKDYGNSFAEQFNEYGILSSVIRMDDKMRRLKQLMSNPANVKDESMIDTVQDLANYAVMTWMELVKAAESNAN